MSQAKPKPLSTPGADPVVRKARRRDAAAMAPLIVELAGPDVSEEQARRRFRRLLRAPTYQCFVLDVKGEPVALWAGRFGYLFAAEAPVVQTIALVVSPQHRGEGFGTLMMTSCPPNDRYCQNWFVTQHEHLHDFYEGLGWSQTGTRFVRHLAPPTERPWLWRAMNKLISL